MITATDNIQVKQAAAEDIPTLVALNEHWLQQNLHGDTSNGFLSGGFGDGDFRHMIQDRMVSVAMEGGKAVAYMLSMNYPMMKILAEHKEVADRITTDGTVPAGSRIAIGVQTAVLEQYHGTGLISEVRRHFLHMLSDRFDYLFTSISKNNPKSFRSATKFGWIVVGEVEDHSFLIYKV